MGASSEEFRPLVEDILTRKDILADGNIIQEPDFLINLKLKSMEQLVRNTNVEHREWSYDRIKRLVELEKEYKTTGAKEQISRILVLLLENKENAIKVLQEEYETYSLIPETGKPVENPVLKYLYSVNATLKKYSGMRYKSISTAHIHAECVKLLNKHSTSLDGKLPDIRLSFYSKIYRATHKAIYPIFYAAKIGYISTFVVHLVTPRPPGTTASLRFIEYPTSALVMGTTWLTLYRLSLNRMFYLPLLLYHFRIF
ncbi:hypothetical protein BdWA1_002613 [Babesia duncani]|uniref:Uncharacterized protein n=1 Tax=Babesia duncani TaxID=323732 RepID=A0AAD9UNT6_9APIC|nr:hypothetical protein BdWA1_002613 [Babesia duncani]